MKVLVYCAYRNCAYVDMDARTCFFLLKSGRSHWRPFENCRKAAKATPFQRFIGWDIAIGKSGPVFIEGNSTGVEVANLQINNRGIMTEEFKNDMLQYGIHFPDKVPGISLRKIYQSYKISRKTNKIG